MDSPNVAIVYVGATTVVFLLACMLRCVFKLTFSPAPKSRSKQIHLTKNQVMEITCNLAKMAARFPDNTQKCIDLVRNYDLDVNFFMPQIGLTIFLSACIGGDAKLVQTLLECEYADISTKSNGGDSPLYLAIAGYCHWPQRHFKIFRLLINAGCNVNEANDSGYSPLHLAASHGDIQLIEFLLEEGANPSSKTLNHSLPIDMAIEAGHAKAAELLDTKHRPHTHKCFPRASTPINIAKHLSPSRRIFI